MKRIKYVPIGAFIVGSFMTYEDEMKVEGKLKIDSLQHLVYRPPLTLSNPHWCTWLTGIATTYHKESTPPFTFSRSIFRLGDGA